MSQESETPFSVNDRVSTQCPSCNGEISTEVWVVVVADERPDLVRKIRSSRIHYHSCPHCEHEGLFDFPLLYIDLKRHGAIFVPPSKSNKDESQKILENLKLRSMKHLTDDLQEHTVQNLQIAADMDQLAATIRPLPLSENGSQEASQEAAEFRAEIDRLPAKQRLERMITGYIYGMPLIINKEDTSDDYIRLVEATLKKAKSSQDEKRVGALQAIYENLTNFEERILSGSIRQFLQDVVSAEGWLECRRIVDKRPELITVDAMAEMNRFMEKAQETGAGSISERLRCRAKLLDRCMQVGIDSAFEEAWGDW